MTQVNLNISLRPTPELVTLAKYLCEALKGISMSDVADDKPALEIIEDKKQQKTATETNVVAPKLERQVKNDVRQIKKELEEEQIPTLEEVRDFLVTSDKDVCQKAKDILKSLGKGKLPDLNDAERRDFYNELKSMVR